MGSKNFEMNDLVWAKMKGYPHWPGQITSPDAKLKPKKKHHYVYFFGSNNNAWIADEFIELHSEKMIEKYGQRKGKLFRNAIQTIIEYAKTAPKHHTLTGRIDDALKAGQGEKKSEKVVKIKSELENKSFLDSSSSQKKKKLSIKKITPVKTEEKLAKQRSYCSIEKESKSHLARGENDDFTWQEEKKKSKCSQSPPPIDATYKSETFQEKKFLPTTKKIGFLGLNNIGKGIIKNLNHSGHSLVIWNETEYECKRFAEQLKIKIAATPAEVMKAADLVFSCMSDPEAAKDIIEGNSGILKGLERSKKKKSYIEMTSMDPKMSQIIETDIKGKGGRYLEAPFCGSSIEANDATLLIVAAGDKTVYDDCRSCFDAISKKHMFISAEVGSASKLNVVHNMLIGTAYASFAEALSLVDKVGLKGEDFCTILKGGDLTNNHMQHKLTSMVKKNYTASTPLKHMQQNFNVGLALANEVALPAKLFASANEVYKRCKMMKYGDHDVSSIFEGTKS